MTRTNRSAIVILLLLLVPGALLAVTPAGPEIAVRVAQAGVAINPLVGVFPDGGFVVAWGTGSPKTVIHARLFDASGTATSGEFRLAQPANQLLDDLKVTADGGFVLVWDQPRTANPNLTSVVARRFGRNGVATTAAFVVHAPSPLSVYNARLAATADNGFVVAWTQDVPVANNATPRRDTFVRYFDAVGAAKSSAILVEQGGLQDDSYLLPGAMAAAADGTVVLASDCVCDQPAIEIHRVVPGVGIQSIDPVPVGDGLLQLSPSLAMAADGSFMVAWQTGSESAADGIPSVIKARRFSAAGSGLGDAFQVNRRGSLEGNAHVAALANGEFAIIWNDGGGRDGSGFGVFSRGFAADGSTAGPDKLVTRQTAGGQFASSLAAASQGVAVWLSPGPTFDIFDPSDVQLTARRLNAN